MKIHTLALGAAALAFAVPGFALTGHGGHGKQTGKVNHANHGDHGAKPQAGPGHQHKPAKANGATKRGGIACPPGLAKKNPGCLPPGQWKKGDRLPASWAGHYTAYDRLPRILRDRYANRADRRYVYQDDKLFVIDAATRAVVDILRR